MIGDELGEGDLPDAPCTQVILSAFQIGEEVVTKSNWDEVRTWAVGNGYPDLAPGFGKGRNHPVVAISWYAAVKFSNAASEREGLTPCYRIDDLEYRSGEKDEISCDWEADGYRLPTEAEWEVAARGGQIGSRFPWGDVITHEHANYFSDHSVSYDQSLTAGDHPVFGDGVYPCTSPVGCFPANSYGLKGMAGNVSQWCWDWFGEYQGGLKDPRGAAQGVHRILRGGYWSSPASGLRCAQRFKSLPEYGSYGSGIGFRLARGNG